MRFRNFDGILVLLDIDTPGILILIVLAHLHCRKGCMVVANNLNSKPHPLLTHYLKSLDFARLQPKPCDLAIVKAASKFDLLVGD
jgi:hypothetical protein